MVEGRENSYVSSLREREETRKERLREVFEEALPMFEEIVAQMREPLREGRWSALLGDDVSGRLPSLVLGGLMRRIAEAHGREAPGQFFFAGGSVAFPSSSLSREANLMKYIKEISPKLGDRVLVVTEYIYQGRTLRMIADALKEAGVSFDVASLASYEEEPEELLLGTDATFFIGRRKTHVTPFFDERRIASVASGVGKKEGKGRATSERLMPFDAQLVREARALADEYSRRLYEKYFEEKEN